MTDSGMQVWMEIQLVIILMAMDLMEAIVAHTVIRMEIIGNTILKEAIWMIFSEMFWRHVPRKYRKWLWRPKL